MFKIGQKVFSKNSGICLIVAMEEINFGIGTQEYFVLESYFNKGSKTYIPVNKADVQLRNLITKAEVKKLLKHLSSCERVWISDPKLRRQKFEEMYKANDLYIICQLVKSLYIQNEELKTQKKSLSMLDKDFLDKMMKDLKEEMSLALNVDLNKMQEEIEKHLN